MNEINIQFNCQSPKEKCSEIEISIGESISDNLYYKFIVGSDGAWKTIQDFSLHRKILWIPEEDGKYTIMVQAKKENSQRSFDYVSKADFIIGKVKEKLITNLYTDKDKYTVGEKLVANVEASDLSVMYRYWIKEKDKWELVKDYSSENMLVWSVKNIGFQEVLVECKHCDSENKFDDFEKIQYEVLPIKKVEITNFKCLTSDLIAGNELIFQVEAVHEDLRLILYKFIKINSDGETECIQDYSSKRIVSFVEKNSGDYKLLCMVRDMYSQNQFDDRAAICYKVKPYKKIIINSFTTDVSSPQICSSSITLKAAVSGGKELVYRFIIDGNNSEDSGYIRSNEYVWNTKKSGEYKVMLWVKDISYEENYEAQEIIDFVIDEMSKDPVSINEVILDKNKKLLINETVNIKTIASGGIDLRYAFNVIKNDKKIESIEYGTCNWVNFTPEVGGNYQIEVLVRDKYSDREYDCHSIVFIEAYNFIPSNIDYILMPVKEYYAVEEKVYFEVITQNTQNTLIKYILSINGHKIEETEYISHKKYSFIPKYSGIYTVEIYARNKDSNNEFDSKKDVKVRVSEALPITNTKIQCDRIKILVKESVTFSVSSGGGKEVVYEFYIMESDGWNLVQNYSRKNFYTFMPFITGKYKVLVLSKSSYKKCSYEDYDLLEFTVE